MPPRVQHHIKNLLLGAALSLGHPSLLLAWTPTGETRPGLKELCHPLELAETLLNQTSAAAKGEVLSRALADCSESWRQGRPQGINADVKMTELETTSWSTRDFTWADANGQSWSGWTLWQPGGQRRPTLLLACDFSCEPDSSPWIKRIIMHLYEEGPFQIVVLRSPEVATGPLVAGGLLYGQALFELGVWLQTVSPWRGKIESLHLVGEGWGAQATLLAQLYNEKNPIASDRLTFHGGLHLCPAVRQSAIFNSLAKPGNWAEARQRDLWIKSLQRRYSWADPARNLDLGEAWLKESLTQTQSWRWLNPFRLRPPRSREQWFEANELAQQIASLRVPSWAMASQQDPRYAAAEHILPLAEQNWDRKKSQLRVAMVADQSQCNWGVSLGWDVEGAIWRATLLSESYEIWPRRRWQKLPGLEARLEVEDGVLVVGTSWQVTQSGEIQIRFDLSDGSTRSQTIDPRTLPEGLRPELSQARPATTWTRVLNARLRLKPAATVEPSRIVFETWWWQW